MGIDAWLLDAWGNPYAELTTLQKISNREWECVVTVAVHSGNLGHGSYSGNWIVVNVNVLIRAVAGVCGALVQAVPVGPVWNCFIYMFVLIIYLSFLHNELFLI